MLDSGRYRHEYRDYQPFRHVCRDRFAIPVDEINQIVPQLIRHGKVVRPRLGVQIAEDQMRSDWVSTRGS